MCQTKIKKDLIFGFRRSWTAVLKPHFSIAPVSACRLTKAFDFQAHALQALTMFA